MPSRTALLLIALLIPLSLSACAPASAPQVQVVEEYLQALVDKDADGLSVLSCAEWEPNALLELDSLLAVETRLEGLACQVSGVDGETTLVTCQGAIIATYNDEDQELDLSLRTYQVVEQAGTSLLCGYR